MPFLLQVEGDERWFTVPADRSILEVLSAEGFDMPRNCQRGQCGTCVAWVVEGQPDHRDICLLPASRAAGDVILTCVSRSLSERLIIAI